MELDNVDKKILSILQKDGRITNQDLAERISLSPAPCWRRVKRLQDEGVVTGYSARVDPAAVGLKVTIFSEITLKNQNPDTIAAFDEFVKNSSQIRESYTVSGGYDYLVKVLVDDIAAYEMFIMQELLPSNLVESCNSMFTLREKKSDSAVVFDQEET